ncbi:MAG TPA: hypothetical protein VFI25_09905 [Planctomycetota bacterium]|jgi:hypothetical protein|nr:hypothetical protein [Planctomycetota bacterium]
MKPCEERTGDLRIFGLAISAPPLVLAWVLRRQPLAAGTLAGLAVLFLVGAAFAPRALRPVKRALDPIAARFAWVVTTLGLLLFYFAAMTPVGFLRRRSRRELFAAAFRGDPATGWMARSPAPDGIRHMERQYT